MRLVALRQIYQPKETEGNKKKEEEENEQQNEKQIIPDSKATENQRNVISRMAII